MSVNHLALPWPSLWSLTNWLPSLNLLCNYVIWYMQDMPRPFYLGMLNGNRITGFQNEQRGCRQVLNFTISICCSRNTERQTHLETLSWPAYQSHHPPTGRRHGWAMHWATSCYQSHLSSLISFHHVSSPCRRCGWAVDVGLPRIVPTWCNVM